MDFVDEDLEDIVDDITKEQFNYFCGREGCNETILDGIRERVKENVLKLKELKKCRAEVILEERKKLIAIYHSEKLLYESGAKDKEEAPEPVASSQTNYFEHLCEYKKDEDLLSRVKGLEMRGKNYKVSKDGSCPTCFYKTNVFVILDFLFPASDMPEMLTYLLSQGKAILWSSKQNMKCKDPPTFLCNGKCPFSDVMRCGFNINWNTTDLEKIFLFPDSNYAEVRKPNKTLSKDKEEEKVNPEEFEDDSEYEIYDEGLVDIEYYRGMASWFVIDEFIADKNEIPAEERSMIRTMLALEQARFDFVNGKMKCVEFSSADGEDAESSSEEENTSDEDKEEENERREEEKEKNKENEQEQEQKNNTILTTQKPVSDVITIPDQDDENSEPVSMDVEIYDLDDNGNAEEKNVVDLTEETETTTAPTFLSPTLDSVFVNAQKIVNSIGVTSTTTTASDTTHILKSGSYYDSKKKSSTKSKPAFTAEDFPVSTNGACPYCLSDDVIYIILKEKDVTSMEKLPELLENLRKQGKAEIRVKGEYDVPSFQCRSCTYGFNLDWASTSLEKIFLSKKPKVTTTAAATNIYSGIPAATTATSYSDYTAYYSQQSAYPNPYVSPMSFMPNIWNGIMPMTWPNCQAPRLPQVVPAIPQVTPGIPQLTPGIPQLTPGIPQLTPGIPQVVPRLTQVPQLTPPTTVIPNIIPQVTSGGIRQQPTVVAQPAIGAPFYQQQYQWSQDNIWAYPPPPPSVIAVSTVVSGAVSTTMQSVGSAVENVTKNTSHQGAPVTTSTNETSATTSEIIEIDMDTGATDTEKVKQDFDHLTEDNVKPQSSEENKVDASDCISMSNETTEKNTGPYGESTEVTDVITESTGENTEAADEGTKTSEESTEASGETAENTEATGKITKAADERNEATGVVGTKAADESSEGTGKTSKYTSGYTEASVQKTSFFEDVKNPPEDLKSNSGLTISGVLEINDSEDVQTSINNTEITTTTATTTNGSDCINTYVVEESQEVKNNTAISTDIHGEKYKNIEKEADIQVSNTDTNEVESLTVDTSTDNNVSPATSTNRRSRRGRGKSNTSFTPRTTRNTRKRTAHAIATEIIADEPKRPCIEEVKQESSCNNENNEDGYSEVTPVVRTAEKLETVDNIDETRAETINQIDETFCNIDETTSELNENKKGFEINSDHETVNRLAEHPNNETEDEKHDASNCDTSIEEILSADDTTELLDTESSPTGNRLFSIEEHVNVNVSKLRNEFTNEESLDATSPFTDSLVNIVADTNTQDAKQEKTDFLFNDLIVPTHEVALKTEDVTLNKQNEIGKRGGIRGRGHGRGERSRAFDNFF